MRRPYFPGSTSPKIRIFPRNGIGLAEVVLVLSAIVAIAWGCQLWQDNLAANCPCTRTALSLTSCNKLPLLSVAISPNQRTAVSVGIEGVVQRYDLQTRTCSGELGPQQSELSAVCISPDGRQILIGTESGEIELWDWDRTQQLLMRQPFHQNRISVLVYSPDGHSFVSAGNDGRTIVWDSHTLEQLFELPSVNANTRTGCFIPASNLLVTGTVYGDVHLWDMTTRQLLSTTHVSRTTEPRESTVEGIQVVSNETQVLVATRDGEIGIWDLKKSTRTLKFRDTGRQLTSLILCNQGRQAIAGGIDGHIDFWDMSTGLCVNSVPAHAGPVNSLAATADSRLVISAGWDGMARFWDQ